MAAIIHDHFKIKTLELFINSLNSNANTLYLGIGRPYFWNTSADTSVPLPEDTIDGFNNDWEDMMSLKRVQFNDLSFGIQKELWAPNIIYDTYRHDWNGNVVASYNGVNPGSSTPKSLGDVRCAVVTSAGNIWLCVKQAKTGNTVLPSVYSPDTGIAVGVATNNVVKTADNYQWQFIGSTGSSQSTKFSSKYYHPVRTLTASPGGLDPYYNQWVAQTNAEAHKGGIYVINVTSAGTGHNGGAAGTITIPGSPGHTDIETDGTFKVVGDGTGLQVTVTFGAGGTITDVQVLDPGAGYTFATITAATSGTPATFDIIFTPITGLGCNPVYDLDARYLLTYTSLTGAEGSGDFTIENEYRKIVAVYNPTNYGSTTVATASTLTATITLVLKTGALAIPAAAAYPIDVIVEGATSGAKARVVDYDEATGELRVIRTSGENIGNVAANNPFVAGETVTAIGVAGQTMGIIEMTTGIVMPEVNPSSGQLIYSEYRMPVTRSVDQTELVMLCVKF